MKVRLRYIGTQLFLIHIFGDGSIECYAWNPDTGWNGQWWWMVISRTHAFEMGLITLKELHG